MKLNSPDELMSLSTQFWFTGFSDWEYRRVSNFRKSSCKSCNPTCMMIVRWFITIINVAYYLPLIPFYPWKSWITFMTSWGMNYSLVACILATLAYYKPGWTHAANLAL